MDLIKPSIINKENINKFSELKKEEATLNDLINRYTEIKINKEKKLFIPLIKNSKIAFFEAKIKDSSKCYTNIGEYVIESNIERKLMRLNNCILQTKAEIRNLNNKNIVQGKNEFKKEEKETIIYNEKKEKIGQLKKLDEDLFEIIEDENNFNENKNQVKTNDLIKDYNEDEVMKKLQEMKNTRNKYKDNNHINFADLEFL